MHRKGSLLVVVLLLAFCVMTGGCGGGGGGNGNHETAQVPPTPMPPAPSTDPILPPLPPAPGPNPVSPDPQPGPTPALPEPIPFPEPQPSIPPSPSDHEMFFESQIKGDFNGWEGETIIKLDNGTYWKQDEFHYSYMYAYRPRITIRMDGGFYYALIEGMSKAVRVIQIKDIIADTRIRGSFHGWRGDTIIELQDGTRWQQDEYKIEFEMEINPEVFIYKDGFRYYAFVDGTSASVRVKRL